MSNLELFDSMLPPTSLQSDNLLRLAKLDLANKDAPTALMQASAANIKNLVSIGQNRSMRLYFLAHPTDYVWPSSLPEPAFLSTKAPTPPRFDGWPLYTKPLSPFRRPSSSMVS